MLGTIGTRQEPHLPLLMTAKCLRNRQGEVREAWAASELCALFSPLRSTGTIPSVDSALEELVFSLDLILAVVNGKRTHLRSLGGTVPGPEEG